MLREPPSECEGNVCSECKQAKRECEGGEMAVEGMRKRRCANVVAVYADSVRCQRGRRQAYAKKGSFCARGHSGPRLLRHTARCGSERVARYRLAAAAVRQATACMLVQTSLLSSAKKAQQGAMSPLCAAAVPSRRCSELLVRRGKRMPQEARLSRSDVYAR